MNTAKRSRQVSPTTRKHAAEMRREPTPAENMLWLELSAHKLNGLKFRRQHPLAGYIVDFCNIEHGLIVEVDGDTHAGKEGQDEERTKILNALGYRVIRFTNEDVMQRIQSVLEQIAAECEDNPPPPPPKGRGVAPASGFYWNTALYDGKHSFVTKYGEDVLALLAPKAGERILDLGCGTGHLTQQIADAGAHVIGLDSSPEMIEAARRTYTTIEFVLADATAFSFTEKFDAVFSNATLHWVRPPDAAVKCIADAIKPAGRFVAEFGSKGNITNIRAAVRNVYRELTGDDKPDEYYFPSIGEYATLLEQHGMEVQAAWLFDRPTPLEGEDGMTNWIKMFSAGMLRGATTDHIHRATAIAERTLRETNYQNGKWFADYRRIRIVAYKQ